MDLNFIKIKDRWVAEFKTSGPFNLHIEGVVEGNVSLFHKTIENGNYAYLRGSTPSPASFSKVYDADFTALVYPKFIKVTCATEPKTATVTAIEETTIIEVIPDSVDFTFNLPMEETDGAVNGTIEGEFTGTYNTVAAFAKGNGVVEDYGYSVKDSSDVDIKVNGYKVGDVEYHETEEFIKMQTDALSSADADGSAVLRKESLSFAYALPVVEPDVPSEPEVIEYHFDIPMHLENSATGDIVENGTPNMLLNACGRVDGDFTELLNKLKALSNEYDELTEDIILERTNVTVNGYRMTTLWYYDESQSWTGEECAEFVNESFETNGACANGIQIHPTYVSMEMYSLLFPNYPNWKEEPEVIEYHFDIPMDSGMGFLGMEGEIQGDFSELHNKLIAFTKANGYSDSSGQWFVIDEGAMQKINITVNGDAVTAIDYYPQYGEINCSTTKSTANFKLYESSAYYEVQGGGI